MTISIKIFRAYSTRRKKRVSEWICIVISFAFQFHCFYFSCSFCIIWTATFTYVEPNRSHRQTNEKIISRFILANEAEFYYRSLFLTTKKKQNKTKWKHKMQRILSVASRQRLIYFIIWSSWDLGKGTRNAHPFSTLRLNCHSVFNGRKSANSTLVFHAGVGIIWHQNGISAVSAVNGNIAASIRSISTMHITYVPEMGEDQRKTKIISFLLLFACEMSNPYILYSLFHYCHSHSGILIQHTHFLSYVPLTDLFIWVYSPFHKSGCQGMKINWRGTFAKCIYAWVWKMVVRTQGNNRQPICAYISLADWLFYLLFLFLFSFELS